MGFGRNLQYAWRQWRARPGLLFVVVFTLGLGIGCTSSIFGVLDAMLLRPLPFYHSRELVAIKEVLLPVPGGAQQVQNSFMAGPDFLAWRRQQKSFSAMAIYVPRVFDVGRGANAERIGSARVSGQFFETLAVPPLQGRVLRPSDGVPGHTHRAVLSYGFWQSHYGGRAGMIGRIIHLDDLPYRVVGIMPPYRGYPQYAQLWIPLNHQSKLLHGVGDHDFLCLGRLRPGVTVAAANLEMEALARDRTRQHPHANANIGARVISLRRELSGHVHSEIWLLIVSVGIILLITCANAGSLLLGRSLARSKELAIRMSLGARLRELAGQWLAESFLLAGLGAGASLLVAYAAFHLLRASRLVPAFFAAHIGLNVPFLVFSLLLTLLVTFAMASLPLLALLRLRPNALLNETAGRGLIGGPRRIHRLIVAGELALLIVLLGQTALLVRSFRALEHVPLGFRSRHLLIFETELPQLKYMHKAPVLAIYERMVRRLNHVPGVKSAALCYILPPHYVGASSIVVRGRPVDEYNNGPWVFRAVTTPGYFRTLGISRMRGRAFTWSDRAGTQPVAVINQAMAKFFWPGQNPLGQQVQIYDFPAIWWTIVGEVANVPDNGLRHRPQPEIYLPEMQGYLGFTASSVALRTRGAPLSVLPAARSVIQSHHPDMPVFRVRTMSASLRHALRVPRARAELMLVLAGLGVFLAAVGVYGLAAYSVRLRTAELGVRMALGAPPRQLARGILWSSLAQAGAGVVVGVLLELLLTRWTRSLLFVVHAGDLPSLLLGVAVLLGMVVLANLPAIVRVLRLDPVQALRQE